MSSREPFKMKWVTAIHNLFLCFSSLVMWIAGAIGCVQVVLDFGIEALYLPSSPKKATGLIYWVLYIFYLSKFPELIDTVILVMKKVSSKLT
jgi:hypothetical protein